MPISAWIGLNDIHNEGTFTYTDGTQAVSDCRSSCARGWTCGAPEVVSLQDLLPWGPDQPDNWEDKEDCVHIRGSDHIEPGKFNDDICTTTREFICKKGLHSHTHTHTPCLIAKWCLWLKCRLAPQPKDRDPHHSLQPLDQVGLVSVDLMASTSFLTSWLWTGLSVHLSFVGWDDKCGTWTSDPFNDYCYLFNYLSMRTWAEARADCVNQGGHLVSITDPFEQAFIQGAKSLEYFCY